MSAARLNLIMMPFYIMPIVGWLMYLVMGMGQSIEVKQVVFSMTGLGVMILSPAISAIFFLMTIGMDAKKDLTEI